MMGIMDTPPPTIDGALVLLWMTRTAPMYFIREAETQHPVMAMAICYYKKSNPQRRPMYLFKCDDQWNVIQDSPCESIEQATISATQWGVQRNEWKFLTRDGEVAVWVEGLSVLDQKKFESRSPAGCSNSDYRLNQTTCCGSYGVEDTELLEFYFDPNDLSRRILLVAGCVCPFCGAKEWNLNEIKSPAEIPPEWRWASRE